MQILSVVQTSFSQQGVAAINQDATSWSDTPAQKLLRLQQASTSMMALESSVEQVPYSPHLTCNFLGSTEGTTPHPCCKPLRHNIVCSAAASCKVSELPGTWPMRSSEVIAFPHSFGCRSVLQPKPRLWMPTIKLTGPSPLWSSMLKSSTRSVFHSF